MKNNSKLHDLNNSCRPRRITDFWTYPRDPGLRRLHRMFCTDSVPKVMLLQGPSGCGKNLVASNVGAWASCLTPLPDGLPCGSCPMCECVYSLDEGIYRGQFHDIDSTQEKAWDTLKEQLTLSGYSLWWSVRGYVNKVSSGRPDVVLIDEVQEFTNQAKLYKLLETEEGTIFILATTDPDRVASPIRSRAGAAVFNLLVPNKVEMANGIQDICTRFNVQIDRVVASWIAAESLDAREALSRLEELSASTHNITRDVWHDVYGSPPGVA